MVLFTKTYGKGKSRSTDAVKPTRAEREVLRDRVLRSVRSLKLEGIGEGMSRTRLPLLSFLWVMALCECLGYYGTMIILAVAGTAYGVLIGYMNGKKDM